MARRRLIINDMLHNQATRKHINWDYPMPLSEYKERTTADNYGGHNHSDSPFRSRHNSSSLSRRSSMHRQRAIISSCSQSSSRGDEDDTSTTSHKSSRSNTSHKSSKSLSSIILKM